MIAGGVEGTGVTCNVLIPGGPADTRMTVSYTHLPLPPIYSV